MRKNIIIVFICLIVLIGIVATYYFNQREENYVEEVFAQLDFTHNNTTFVNGKNVLEQEIPKVKKEARIKKNTSKTTPNLASHQKEESISKQEVTKGKDNNIPQKNTQQQEVVNSLQQDYSEKKEVKVKKKNSANKVSDKTIEQTKNKSKKIDQTQISLETFRSDKYEFSISFPTEWVNVTKHLQRNAMILAAMDPNKSHKEENSPAMMQVFAHDMNVLQNDLIKKVTVDSYTYSAIENLEKLYDNFTLYANVPIDYHGLKARKLIYSFTREIEDVSFNFQYMSLVVRKDNYLYVIELISDQNFFVSYMPLFEKILETSKIK